MEETILIGLALVLVLGIVAQWLAWRIRLASILILLLFGIIAGPVAGILHTDELFGELLLPLVSLSVAIILFEGGMSLRYEDLRGLGRAMWGIITIGAFVTWMISASAAYFILNLEIDMALLLGAILVVTGPTVVTPLIQQIRPVPRVSSILRWEGILIDPIGAILAVLVFEQIISNTSGLEGVISTLVTTVLIGISFGVIGANVLIEMFRRLWVPDRLHNSFTLMTVLGLFTLSNVLQSESGLLTVTVLGIAMANQKRFDVHNIIEFEETLQVLLISSLFILLGSRLDLNSLIELGLSPLLFVGVLMFVARPLSVWLSTRGTGLSWQETVFISWMAPRGIIAAAVASIFSIELISHQVEGAEVLVPMTFSVIIITVATYSLTAGPLARYLNLVERNPQGVLMVGAHSWARKIAIEIHKAGFHVILADSNQANILAAQKDGLETFHGNILSEYMAKEFDLSDIGHVMALTSNDEVNSLVAVLFKEHLEHCNMYQIAKRTVGNNHTDIAQTVGGQTLFADDMTFEQLQLRFGTSDAIKVIRVRDEDNFYESCIDAMLPLFVVKNNAELHFWTAHNTPSINMNESVVGLVKLTELDMFSTQEIVPIERVTQAIPILVLEPEITYTKGKNHPRIK